MNDYFARTMLTARQIQEDTGMTLDQILALPVDEYARLTGRPTVRELVAQALDAEPPGRPRQEAVPTQQPAPEPQGIALAAMDMQQYAAVRGQLGVGGREYGVGIMNGGQGTSDWVAAAQAKSGRSAMNERNVQQAPQLGRAFVQQEPLDSRPASERFITPGNSFGA